MTDIQIINDYSSKLAYKTETIVSIINMILNSENKSADAVSVILTNKKYLAKALKQF